MPTCTVSISPFDLPGLAFYRRGREIYDWLVKFTGAANFPRIALSTLATITRHLAALREDADLVAAAERLEKAERLFNELRQLLRLDGDIHASGVRAAGANRDAGDRRGAGEVFVRMGEAVASAAGHRA